MIKGLKEVVYGEVPKNGMFQLVGDIGGTNANFGLFDRSDRVSRLLMSFHIKTATITDPTILIAELVEYLRTAYCVRIIEACIGAAGIVRRDRLMASLTNAPITLDAHAIAAMARFERVLLINDFEAAGLGLDALPASSFVVINKGSDHRQANRVCIGAGTGLGKVTLVWHLESHSYVPIVSEGGHADCSAHDSRDMALFEFIKAKKGAPCPVSWEEVLSGRGITWIYQFLGTVGRYQSTAITTEIAEHRFQPDRISAYAQKDPHCADTFAVYTTLYARCAKNFALDVLARGGVSLAGGIAAKNTALFKDSRFMKEFTRCGRYSDLLADIRVQVVLDYNVSLFGAHRFIRLHDAGIL
jgi:glucokinase